MNNLNRFSATSGQLKDLLNRNGITAGTRPNDGIIVSDVTPFTGRTHSFGRQMQTPTALLSGDDTAFAR